MSLCSGVILLKAFGWSHVLCSSSGPPSPQVFNIWDHSCNISRDNIPSHILAVAIVWNMWKKHNDRIFGGSAHSIEECIYTIFFDSHYWTGILFEGDNIGSSGAEDDADQGFRVILEGSSMEDDAQDV